MIVLNINNQPVHQFGDNESLDFILQVAKQYKHLGNNLTISSNFQITDDTLKELLWCYDGEIESLMTDLFTAKENVVNLLNSIKPFIKKSYISKFEIKLQNISNSINQTIETLKTELGE